MEYGINLAASCLIFGMLELGASFTLKVLK